MNRLAAPFAPHETFSSSTLDFPAHTSPSASPASARSGARRRRSPAPTPGVALFSPYHYEPRYAYPLVIWLHDDGGSERELPKVMGLISTRNYVGAAVRGLPRPDDAGPGFGWRQTIEAIDAAADGVDRCIEQALRQFHIHPERIFLAGHGTGGTMALRLALQAPQAVGGVASLNGPLPRGHCPLARVNQARRLPLLMMTCQDSVRYPASHVVEDLRLLHAGGFSLGMRHYLCGDELYTDMFRDIDQWMMARVCGAPSPALA